MPDHLVSINLSKINRNIKMKNKIKKIVLSIVVLLLVGISPNLFVISQAGYASLSELAQNILIPSIVLLIIVYIANSFIGLKDLNKKIRNGLFGGLLATIGLEIVRETGFHLGGMPGDMPKLLGVFLLDRFALGPNTMSNIAGWSFHFWNGASFGIIYSILIGQGNIWKGVIFGLLVGIGFMMSPAVIALGVGYFGLDFGIGFSITVIAAHLAFGSILGWFVFRKNSNSVSLLKEFSFKN